jgi:hypothetical protein
MSPLKAALKVVQRSNAAKHASVMAFENGGAVGVLFVDDDRMTAEQGEEQIAAIKTRWANEYEGPNAFRKLAHSGYKTGFTKITDTLVDMNLIKVEDLDLRRLANIWGIPSQLLNDPENKTYNNQREAEKALTSRCALPKLVTRRDNLNRKLQDHWGFKGVNVYADFGMEVYTELQEDLGEKWKYVKELPMSWKDKLDMMGIDAPEDAEGLQEIMIPSGFQRLADVGQDLTEDMNAIEEEERRRDVDAAN